MDLFTREALTELAHADQAPAISLFMPTYRVESELAQNPIRLKNLLKEARRRLREAGYKDSLADAILLPAEALLDREQFWFEMSDGIAAFLSEDGARFFRLPVQFDELVVCGERFHLKPVFPLLASNNRFFVLALSQNQVKLYQGTHYGISEVHTTDIPLDIHDAVLKYEVDQQSTQFHTGAKVGGPAGRQEAIRHGQGRQSDDQANRPKDLIWRFFQQVDDGVREVLRDETAPLVLASVQYYLPIYREVNSYPHLVEDGVVAGNAEHLAPHELHRKAWQVMEPIFRASQEEALDRFEESLHREGDMASAELSEIVPAARFSRVDTLFVSIGAYAWGRFDPESAAVETHREREAGDDDLLDFAAVHTFLNGGTVHALRPENMPEEAQLAAVFRFPVAAGAV